MNFYTIGIEGMPKLLQEIDRPLENFKRNTYESAFRTFFEQNLVIFEAIENGYQQVVDKDQFLTNMAAAMADAASEEIEQISRNGRKEKKLMDYNFCLAVYVLPAILEYKRESSKILADKVLEAWKEKFPKTNIQASTFEAIQAGFKKKWCYVTTAVCETFGKPDDCYELTLFRDYRDTYLALQEDGEDLIREYYDLAPTIVKHINKKENRKEIYENIWKEYLNPCIGMIEQGNNAQCKELYVNMVRDLQEKYFIELS